jgi:hypothetical protein
VEGGVEEDGDEGEGEVGGGDGYEEGQGWSGVRRSIR